MTPEEKKSMRQQLKIVNKYKHEPTSDDVYIGRGSLFGSPYSHLPSKFKDITLCDSREEALESYKEYFNSIIDGCGCKNKDFKQKLREIIVKL